MFSALNAQVGAADPQSRRDSRELVSRHEWPGIASAPVLDQTVFKIDGCAGGPQARFELLRIKGFGQVIVGPGIRGRRRRLLRLLGCEQHDIDVRCTFPFPHFTQTPGPSNWASPSPREQAWVLLVGTTAPPPGGRSPQRSPRSPRAPSLLERRREINSSSAIRIFISAPSACRRSSCGNSGHGSRSKQKASWNPDASRYIPSARGPAACACRRPCFKSIPFKPWAAARQAFHPGMHGFAQGLEIPGNSSLRSSGGRARARGHCYARKQLSKIEGQIRRDFSNFFITSSPDCQQLRQTEIREKHKSQTAPSRKAMLLRPATKWESSQVIGLGLIFKRARVCAGKRL